MTLTKLQPNWLILVEKIITKECPPFNPRLSSVMSLILTYINLCFIWQLYCFVSISFPTLLHRFMKRGTYIASLLKRTFWAWHLLNWCYRLWWGHNIYQFLVNFLDMMTYCFCGLFDQSNPEDTLFLQKHH